MNDNEQQLKRELQRAGASASDIPELVPIAAKLKLLANTKPGAEAPYYRPQRTRWVRFMAAGAILAVLFGVVLASQMALPDSPLYPLQKISDYTAIALHPSYRANVMMKRARQVKLLVEKRAPPATVLAALAEYQSVTNGYRVNATNYEAFEYCKNNLQAAAAIAPSSERPAINSTLSSLKDI